MDDAVRAGHAPSPALPDPGAGPALRAPSRVVVALEGELDVVTVPGVVEALAAVPADADLVLDLSRVSFADSVALGAILSAHRRHAQAGARVLLTGTQPAVLRLLQVTQLDRMLPTVADVDAEPREPV